MWFPSAYNPMGKNQIAGAETMNPVLAWIKYFASVDDFIELNPNRKGSIDISLNAEALKAWLSQTMKTSGETFDFHFKCTVNSNNSITVGGGSVLWGNIIATVAGTTVSGLVNGNVIYAKMTASNTGTIQYGSLPSSIIDLGDSNTNPFVNLPIAYTRRSGGEWYVEYSHIGDFIFPTLPYIWLAGFAKSEWQSLDHHTDGTLKWTTYGQCE